MRIKISLPEKFPFTTRIPIRITDVNYGGHVGNDSVLSIMHEARMQFLASYGYSEMNFGGVGMIMREVFISFKSELFYGDIVIASVAAAEFSGAGFGLFYKLEKESDGKIIAVAYAQTGMVCYDYDKKKIMPVPDEARKKILHPD
jgi:acyl-CoA thioester hydrolase